MKLRTAMMFVLALGISGVANAAGEIIIKFSHVVAPDTPKGQAAERFKQLAEKYSKGKVKVEIYPNSQLYKDREEIEALQSGAVQMLAPSMAKFRRWARVNLSCSTCHFCLPIKKHCIASWMAM